MLESAKHILSCVHLTMQHHVMATSCALGLVYILIVCSCMCAPALIMEGHQPPSSLLSAPTFTLLSLHNYSNMKVGVGV